MEATAAIVMHYSGDDWSAAQIAGLHDQFGKMGIEVIAETDAGFDAADAGLGHRDGPGPQPEHHRLDPDRPCRHRRRLPAGRRAGGEDRLHGQRAAGVHARHGLCQRRLGGQLRQRRRLRAPHGRGARRRGSGRHRLPRRRLLRHPPALRRVQGDDRGELSRTSRSSRSKASPGPTSPVRPTRSPPPCSPATPI